MEVWIIRHGQATHNPRAEAAKARGCSFDDFLELMRQDDSLDSPLTFLGQEQAKQVHQTYFATLSSITTNNDEPPFFDAIASSPLSRALQTADLVLSPLMVRRRICCEYFREINGCLLNAQRRPRSELQRLFSHWNFDHLEQEEDHLWTPETFETNESCRERGYQGLCWLLQRCHQQQDNDNTSRMQDPFGGGGGCSSDKGEWVPRVLLVCHGGILRQTMAEYPERVLLQDGRTRDQSRPVTSRFGNAELRRFRLQWQDEEEARSKSNGVGRKVVLTELDLPL